MKQQFAERTPENILSEVRFQVADHTGKKKSHVTAKTRLTHLDGDGIFDVVSIMCDVFGIEKPSDEITENFVEGNVQKLVDYVMGAPMQKIKPNKAGGKKLEKAPAVKASGKKQKYPEVETPTTIDADSLAYDIADLAATDIKSGRNWTFTYCDNELQMRDPKTDDIFAVVTIVVNAMQVGFIVTHFPQPDAHTWDICVPFASWSLGTPYTLCRRYDMAAQLNVIRPADLHAWLVDTIANRVQFISKVAPLFKKLTGTPPVHSQFLISEIGATMDIEIEDSVFDVYTNLNKMETSAAVELRESLDGFFTQVWDADYYTASTPEVVKAVPITDSPRAKLDDTVIRVRRELENDSFNLFDWLNGVATNTLAGVYIAVFGKSAYLDLLGADKPLSKTRNKMIDKLVGENSAKDIARLCEESDDVDVREFAATLYEL